MGFLSIPNSLEELLCDSKSASGEEAPLASSFAKLILLRRSMGESKSVSGEKDLRKVRARAFGDLLWRIRLEKLFFVSFLRTYDHKADSNSNSLFKELFEESISSESERCALRNIFFTVQKHSEGFAPSKKGLTSSEVVLTRRAPSESKKCFALGLKIQGTLRRLCLQRSSSSEFEENSRNPPKKNVFSKKERKDLLKSCVSKKSFLRVRKVGLEPTCTCALPPQDSASTNFATFA